MTDPITPEALDELHALYSAGYIVDCIIPQVTLLAMIDELREARSELQVLRDNPELDACPRAVFVARMIRNGASYDAESGIWWGNTPESKPGIIRQLEAQRDAALREVETLKRDLEWHKKPDAQKTYERALQNQAK